MAGLFDTIVTTTDSPRFLYRHVHRTISAFVEEKMITLGWPRPASSGPQPTVNFGATPVTYQEIQPDENNVAIASNTVAITPGDESDDVLGELGGGFWEVTIPFFFDVYGDDQSISKSIAADIKSLLTRGTCLPLYDWTSGTPTAVTGSYIEFEFVIGPERPPAAQQATDFRRFWSVVKAEAHVYYTPASS
jgi:hypothetical protein